jgi:hypothetical protein
MKRFCVQSQTTGLTCARCGAVLTTSHNPLLKRGYFCKNCCPVCARKSAAPRPAPAKPVPQPAAVENRPGGSQFRDDGWGLRPGDPFLRDDRREADAERWIPRRPNWLNRHRGRP